MSDAAPVVPVDAPADAPAVEAPPVEATPAEVKPPDPPPAPRTIKAKVYGREADLPAETVESLAKALGVTPDQFLRHVQTAAASQRAFEDAAKSRKETDAIRARMKSNPWDVLREDGMDPDALAIQRVQALMEQESMTQEQRRIAALEAEKAQAEARAKALEDQQRQASQQVEMQQAAAQLNKVIPEAAERAGLPRSPVVGRMMVEHMLSQARAGITPDPDAAAEYAAETVRAWQSAAFTGADDAKIVSLLGPEVAKRVAAYMAGQARSVLPGSIQPTQNGAPKPKAAPRTMTVEEWRAQYG